MVVRWRLVGSSVKQSAGGPAKPNGAVARHESLLHLAAFPGSMLWSAWRIPTGSQRKAWGASTVVHCLTPKEFLEVAVQCGVMFLVDRRRAGLGSRGEYDGW